jgi:hypothetical protein
MSTRPRTWMIAGFEPEKTTRSFRATVNVAKANTPSVTVSSWFVSVRSLGMSWWSVFHR